MPTLSDAVPQAEHSVLPIRHVILVFGALVGLVGGFAGLYFSTLAIFLKPIAVDFGWARADLSAVVMMSMLGMALGAPFVGILIDRLGARRLIGISVVLFAACIFSFSILPASRLLFATVSLVTGIAAVATGPSGYLSVLPRWFDRRLGLALSCAMVGAGIGATGMPMLTQWLIDTVGWRYAYQWLALVALGLGGIAVMLLGARPGGSTPVRQHTADIIGYHLSAALRDGRFWLLAAILFVTGAAGLGVVVHFAALLNDRGLSPTLAARAAAMVGIGLALGRFVAGGLMDIIFAPLVGAMAYVLAAIGLAVIGLNLTDAFFVVALSAFLFGLAIGAEGDFMAFVVRRYFGRKSFAGIYGCLFAAYSLGGVAGPILFGLAYDRMGNYTFVIGMSTAGFVLGALALMLLGSYRFKVAAPI